MKYTYAARVLAAVLIVCGTGTAVAQDYPIKTLRMLSAGPGGGSDLSARLIAQGLAESLGQQVVVDTRVGGIIIADIAAKAAPDGYTLMTYSSTLWLIPLMRTAPPYDPIRDFAPITLVGSSPMVLVTHPSVSVASVKDLIALARSRPGDFNFATGPSGAVPHLAGELFKAMAGVDIVQIAYKGVGLAVTDVIGGRVQMYRVKNLPRITRKHTDNYRHNQTNTIVPAFSFYSTTGRVLFFDSVCFRG